MLTLLNNKKIYSYCCLIRFHSIPHRNPRSSTPCLSSSMRRRRCAVLKILTISSFVTHSSSSPPPPTSPPLPTSLPSPVPYSRPVPLPVHAPPSPTVAPCSAAGVGGAGLETPLSSLIRILARFDRRDSRVSSLTPKRCKTFSALPNVPCQLSLFLSTHSLCFCQLAFF